MAHRPSFAPVFSDSWLDTIEALPMELQRAFTHLKELDAKTLTISDQAKDKTHQFLDVLLQMTPEERNERMAHLTQLLQTNLELGEEKVTHVVQTYDMIDRHIRRLDEDLQHYEDEMMMGARAQLRRPNNTLTQKFNDNDERRARSHSPNNNAQYLMNGNHKKRGRTSDKEMNGHLQISATPHTMSTLPSVISTYPTASFSQLKTNKKEKYAANNGRRLQKDVSKLKEPRPTANTTDMPVDPNEPLYCICNQVSFGEMIACDDPDCDVEWFHYPCVGLTAPPKGQWFCPECKKKKA